MTNRMEIIMLSFDLENHLGIILASQLNQLSSLRVLIELIHSHLETTSDQLYSDEIL